MTAEGSVARIEHEHPTAGIEVRLLGPIEVADDAGHVLNAGTRKQRALLTILALARGQVVSADRLVQELWGDEPPAQALASLYPYVSNLRRLMEPRRDGPPSVLLTVPPGYVLRLGAEALDAARFEEAAGHVPALLAAGQLAQARTRASAALSMWRGPALGEFASEAFAELEAVRLEELRLAVTEDLFEARLGLHDGRLIPDVEQFVDEHPLRERAWALLVRALCAARRQSDALDAYRRVHAHLLDELGVEPGPDLQQLQRAIVRGDGHLPASEAVASGVPPSREPSLVSPPAGQGSSDVASGVTAERLVGRDAELKICEGVLEEISRGPRAVIVEGEPGIGKTRLLEELAEIAEQHGTLVLWCRAFEGGAAPAFWPWLPALRTLAGLVPRAAVPAHLAALLPSSPSTTTSTAETARFTLFDSIATLLEDVSELRSIMIVLDDLQWADVASLELVTTLTTRLTKRGILLAATTRELEVGRNDALVAALAALTRMTGSRRIRLRGLGLDDSAQLLAAVTGTPIHPATAATVYDRAEGNPFFTAELARLIAASSTDQARDVDIPAGVRDVIRRRLEPLPAATVEVLQVASVIGRDVDLDLLARASGQEILDCLEHLEPAVLQRLVVHLDERPGSYRFVHALVREVLVDEMSPLQLAVDHLRIADALGGADDDGAEILAEHLWAAAPLGVGHRAAEALERAAHVAVRRSAYESAEHMLERAVDLYRSAADTDSELRALTQLASVVGAHRGYGAFNKSPNLARARQLVARTTVDLNHVVLQVAEFIGRLASCEFEAADPIADNLLTSAETADDPLIRSLGHGAYGLVCWYHGRLAEAVVHLETALAAARDAPPLTGDSPVNAVQLLTGAPILLQIKDLMDELDDPRARSVEVEHLISAVPHWALITRLFSSLGALMVGDAQRALDEADDGIARDAHGSFGLWSMGLRSSRLAGLCLTGDLADGTKPIDEMMDVYVPGTQRTGMSNMLANAAIGLAGMGRLEEAVQAATLARREIGDLRDLYTEPVVLLAEAVVAAASGAELEAVTRLLNQALVITERQGAKAVAARLRRTAETLGLHAVASVPPVRR